LIWSVKGTELLGEDAGEADGESIVKEEADVTSKQTVKVTDSSLNDSDKLKRPKRKRKKYITRTVSYYLCQSRLIPL